MIYRTEFRKGPAPKPVSFFDILEGVVDMERFEASSLMRPESFTVTKRYTGNEPHYNQIALESVSTDNFGRAIQVIMDFHNKWESLYSKPRQALYTKFFVPKQSGGYREINAPCDELKAAMRELNEALMWISPCEYHTSAYGFIRNRSTVDAVRKHAAFGSNWYLHTDFHDFFGSMTPEFLRQSMLQIMPYKTMYDCNPEIFEKLMDCISLAFLNGGLPQGNPISPYLTNLAMIPIDFEFANKFASKKICYSRYADDIQISAKEEFPWKKVLKYMDETLKQFNAPFSMKPEKTRLNHMGTWMLGVHIDEHHHMTAGWENRKRFRSEIFTYLMMRKNHEEYDRDRLYKLRGMTSYFYMIDREFISDLISKMSNKTGVDFHKQIKKDLKKLAEAASEPRNILFFNGQKYEMTDWAGNNNDLPDLPW